jgi:hypothetical protein
VIFVDRWAAHRNSKLVEVWHKMPVQVFETLIKRPNFSHFFDTARDKVHAYFEVTTSLKSRIAYIDRQSSSRKIPDEDHVKLLADMKALAKEKDWDFAHLILENMKPEEQFREVSKANVSCYDRHYLTAGPYRCSRQRPDTFDVASGKLCRY